MKKITHFIIALLFGFTLNAQTVATDSIHQLTTCAGDDIIVTFTTTGNFPLSNKFIAQISNAFGQFNNPTDIGNTKFAFFGKGIILAKLPMTATLGIFYKIRVISTNPKDTSVSPNNVIITTIPTQLNTILRTCQNDSTILSSSLIGSEYSWSNGATTQSITPPDTGIYTVTTKDPLGCKTTVSYTITDSVNCVSLPFLGIDNTSISNLFSIYPNPNNGICTLSITKTNSNYFAITIVDILGQEVYKLSDNNSSTEYKKDIHLEHLAKGIYSIKLNLGSEIKTQKIIIE